MKQKKDIKAKQVNQVKIAFTKKLITPFAGIAALIGKFLEELNFKGWVEANIGISECSPNAKGLYTKVLGQFLTILVGGTRFSHMEWWRNGEEILYECFGVKWLPKATSVLTRFWNKVTQPLANGIAEAARKLVLQLMARDGIVEDNLNFDSTVLTRYGKQEGAKKGYNPKKQGRLSHHPLLAFLGSGYVVNVWNRSGDTASGSGILDFFKQTLKAVVGQFSIQRILCDSGFYRIDFIEYLEANGYVYIISAPMSRVLQQRIWKISQWIRVDQGLHVSEFYFEHEDEKWEGPRRYVVIRQKAGERPNARGKQLALFENMVESPQYRYSLLITNDEKASPEKVWRNYRPRANDENAIKDLKEGYGFAAFNTENFWATEAVMVMNALVFHNLIHYLNRKVLSHRGPVQQMKTIRSKYLILPAQLGNDGGYRVLRIAVKDKGLRARLVFFLEQITRFVDELNCIAVETG
jgi:hypothetical protein